MCPPLATPGHFKTIVYRSKAIRNGTHTNQSFTPTPWSVSVLVHQTHFRKLTKNLTDVDPLVSPRVLLFFCICMIMECLRHGETVSQIFCQFFQLTTLSTNSNSLILQYSGYCIVMMHISIWMMHIDGWCENPTDERCNGKSFVRVVINTFAKP